MMVYRIVENIFTNEDKIYKSFTTLEEAKREIKEYIMMLVNAMSIYTVEETTEDNFLLTFSCGLKTKIFIKEVDNGI